MTSIVSVSNLLSIIDSDISPKIDTNKSPIIDIYRNVVPEELEKMLFPGLEQLLLKHELVNSQEQFFALYRSILTKTSDFNSDWIIIRFAVKFSEIFKNRPEILDQEELERLFEIMLYFFSWCSDENLIQFTQVIYECFESISSYNNIKAINHAYLPLDIHLIALDICRYILYKNISANGEAHKYILKTLLDTLAHIINHKDCSSGIQRTLISFIQSVSKAGLIPSYNKIRLLNTCSVLEHASPDFHSFVIDKLLDYTRRKIEPVDKAFVDSEQYLSKMNEYNSYLQNRMLSMEKFPLDPNFLNVCEKSRNDVIEALVNIVLNQTEDITLRINVAKKLSAWVWTSPKFQYKPNIKQAHVIDKLVHVIINNKVYSESIVNQVSIDLFTKMGMADHMNPIGRYVVYKYKELINDNSIPTKIKVKLASCMPEGYDDLCPEKPHAIELFFFMLEKLYDGNHPLELKKIYVQKLTLCYLSKESCKAIGERDKTIASIEDFMKLDIFKTDLVLGITFNNIYNELFTENTLITNKAQCH